MKSFQKGLYTLKWKNLLLEEQVLSYTLKWKNLLLEEQVLSFKSIVPFEKGGINDMTDLLPWKHTHSAKYIVYW